MLDLTEGKMGVKKILVWFLAGARDIFCSPKHKMFVQLVPVAVSRR